MIPSHMRYNSPVERKAEQGDSDGRETARKAGLGKRLRFLLAQRFHKAKRAKVINNNNNALIKRFEILTTDQTRTFSQGLNCVRSGLRTLKVL